MNQNNNPKIFISYAHEDSEIAERLYNDLKNEGFSPWLDKESLLPGQRWKEVISRAIKESSLFLALLSPNSVGKKGYVQKELKSALDILDEFPSDKIYLIPVYIEPCEPSEERLKDFHEIRLYESYEKALQKLFRALNSSENIKNAASAIPTKPRQEHKVSPEISENRISEPKPIIIPSNLRKILIVLAAFCLIALALVLFIFNVRIIDRTKIERPSITTIDKTVIPETIKEPVKKQPTIDVFAAKLEEEKQKEEQLKREKQKQFEQRQQRLTQVIEKYNMLIKQYGSQKKDQAWQTICYEFPELTQGVNTGDTIELRIKAGLTINAGDIYIEPITDMEFVWVPQGCYQMGSDSGEAESDEKPVHEVCVDGFWMAKTEVTNKQYRKFKRDHNSKDYQGVNLNGDDQPAVYVSWDDAKAFAKWLSEKSGQHFSLPTEAQWEYAARAGTKTERYWGDNPDEACKYANVYDEAGKKKFNFDWTVHKCNDGYAATAPVGSFKPNNFGLYDMLGNVWEWCEDVYDSDAYKKHERNNPVITSGSTVRVIRGGSWDDHPRNVRAAFRDRNEPDDRSCYVGFRLCLSQVR
jgi:formylglycine-generating enzyme